MAPGRVRLFLGAATDPEKIRDRHVYDHEDQLEPVQPDAPRYLPLERDGRLRGADPFYHHSGTVERA